MRRILLILLLLLCGLTPAQKKVLLTGSQNYEQLVRQHGPTLWLDASDPTTITASAGAISAWASKVGAISFTQATGGNQPTLVCGAAGINGRCAVQFDGAASYMTTGGVWASIMSNSAKTIIAAMRTNPTAVNKPLLGMQSAVIYFYVNDSSQFVVGNYDGGWDILTNTSPVTSAAKASIAVMVHNGITLRSWLDNGPVSSVASGDTNSLVAAQAQLGTINASLFYNGEAGEILIFNKPLPDDVIFKIQKGLCKKWGASC